MLQPVYVDIHIHTSENPNISNNEYNVDVLVEKLQEIAKGKPIIVSLTDHNMINKKAYLELCKKINCVILGVELHIKKYEEAPPYHCHILFECEVSESNIDEINRILDELYPDKIVTDTTPDIPNIERISNAFDNFDYILLPHGGQSHRTFDKATAKGHRFDTSMERSIYYNHFEGFTARSNSGLEETNLYFQKLGISQFTNLITCSDNYNPSVYPAAKSKDAESFIPTWILSEPTYAGLKLALSETSRLHYGEKPPEKWNQSIFGVNLDTDNCHIDVELLPGLNVVIGGSSSGKTLFVDSVVSGIKADFEGSPYKNFGIKNIIVNNPSGIVPHYINQNFIISVLQNGELQLGDIELINEVFPEENTITQRIRHSLERLKRLVDQLLDSVKDYERNIDSLSHLAKPSHLIVSKEVPRRISSVLKGNAEERGKYSLNSVDYDNYLEILAEIECVFEKSQLELTYKDEINSIKAGLKYILELSNLSENVSIAIGLLEEHEIASIAEDDQENSQKINQSKTVKESLIGALKALSRFYKTKEELSKFNITVSTREIVAGGHRLKIENSFRLTQEALIEAINKYLKSEKRVSTFAEIVPETLYKSGYSERPRVTDHSDFSKKIYDEISNKNIRTYRITTTDGRDFDTLSPGWKSSVILDLLLGYEGDVAPLIIDQPEDNLATDYINHGLVDQIKKIKPKKQIILVSHNATIPMLGDAQNVIVCHNNDGKIEILSAPLESSINGKRILDYIADITDGGKPSIRKRVKKYDLKKYRGN